MVSKTGKLVLQMVGFVFAIGEAMAPFGTFRRIITQQDVGPNTIFPYELLWVNGLVQLSYAVRKDDQWAIGVYSVVVGITAGYCLVYVWFSTGMNRVLGWSFVMLKIVVVGGLIAGELTLFNDEQSRHKRDQLQGEVMAVITFLLYISPGMEVYEAFKTHEVGGLNILLALAFLCNAIIATASACLPFSMGSLVDLFGGLMGIVCSVVQCVVWLRCYYHGHHVAHHPMAQLFELMGIP